jgi:4-diphosphocytidyl-2-C-methyl-D-erythritol kinase
MEALRLEAPAKINLGLTVVGRRDDGFHLLRSRVVLLELADQLLLMPGCAGMRIDGATDDVPVGGENLAWRGLVAGLSHEPDLCCLALEKRIPVAAGMGGGSSDAAAAWRLGRAWRAAAGDATQDDLDALVRIGADVPFFAAAVPAAEIRGVGERVTPVAALDAAVVLVHPPFALSTRAVFTELRREDWGQGADNDLLTPALRLRPEIGDVMGSVERAGGEPRLSGSGPTVYALTDDAERADRMAEELSRQGLRVSRTRTRRAAASIERITEEEP